MRLWKDAKSGEWMRDDSRPNVDPTEEPAIQTHSSLVNRIIKDIKTWKALRPSRLYIEILKISGEVEYSLVTRPVNRVLHEGIILKDVYSSIIFNCYKDKGDILDK